LPLGTTPIQILQDSGHVLSKEIKEKNLLFDNVVDEPNEFEFLI